MASRKEEQENAQIEEIKKLAQEIGQESAKNYVPPMPMDKLEMQSLLVNPSWGQDNEYSPAVKQKFITEEDNQQHLDEFSAIYKRDLRVGNLSKLNGELHYCSEHIDMSRDCLNEGFPMASLTAQSRAITTIEISHNDSGFFRKTLNTFRKEESHEIKEPKDKGILGQPKQGDDILQ